MYKRLERKTLSAIQHPYVYATGPHIAFLSIYGYVKPVELTPVPKCFAQQWEFSLSIGWVAFGDFFNLHAKEKMF